MSGRDGIIITGLVLIGAGLFFSVGVGPALAVPGALLWGMGCLMHVGDDRRGRR